MLIIQEVLVSNDIVDEHFACELMKCKGACCVEGDFGAPLDDEELEILDAIYPEVEPYISDEGRAAIAKDGLYKLYRDGHVFMGTALQKDGACAFVSYDELGIAWCGIEKAWMDKKIEFRKPISCQLYPIRLTELPEDNFTALNYDRWEICSPACEKGAASGTPLYVFLREAITRKFGVEFYDELDAAAQFIKNKQD
jgi:hypothetical protein